MPNQVQAIGERVQRRVRQHPEVGDVRGERFAYRCQYTGGWLHLIALNLDYVAGALSTLPKPLSTRE